MSRVIESLSTFPRLIFGTMVSFFGAASGTVPEVQRTPPLQQLVWAASIFAAVATGLLAVVRACIEIKKFCRRRRELD